MAVSELLRGLGGALTGFLLVLVLLASSTETRDRFGRSVQGVAWVGARSNSERFDHLAIPVLYFGLPATVIGYMTGVRITSRRRAVCTLAGGGIGLLIGLLLPSPLAEKFGRAGVNTLKIISALMLLGGPCVGALIAERRERRFLLLDDECV